MKILTSLNGIFPRSQQLIETTRQFEHKKISIKQLEKFYTSDYNNLKNITRNFDLISDGLINWSDLLRPFSQLVTNSQVNGLFRYCETNNFYRKVILPSKIDLNFKKIFPKYFRFGNTAFLPSPYLFKKYSNAKYETVVRILFETIKFLKSKNYIYFVLQNPKTDYEKDTEELIYLKKLVNNVRRDSNKVKIIINAFFYKIYDDIKGFLSLDVDAIGIDFNCNSLDRLKRIRWKKDMGIFAGLLNNMTTSLENTDMVKKFIVKIQDALYPSFIIISGAPDFEFLPLEYAVLKVNLLTNIKEALQTSEQSIFRKVSDGNK